MSPSPFPLPQSIGGLSWSEMCVSTVIFKRTYMNFHTRIGKTWFWLSSTDSDSENVFAAFSTLLLYCQDSWKILQRVSLLSPFIWENSSFISLWPKSNFKNITRVIPRVKLISCRNPTSLWTVKFGCVMWNWSRRTGSLLFVGRQVRQDLLRCLHRLLLLATCPVFLPQKETWGSCNVKRGHSRKSFGKP